MRGSASFTSSRTRARALLATPPIFSEKAKPIPQTTLRAATAHRIDQQIKRAFRHTYGAEAGLRTLVRLAAEEMLQVGASRKAIRDALVARVHNHIGAGKTSLLTGETRSASLTKLISSWCDEACERQPKQAGTPVV